MAENIFIFVPLYQVFIHLVEEKWFEELGKEYKGWNDYKIMII